MLHLRGRVRSCSFGRWYKQPRFSRSSNHEICLIYDLSLFKCSFLILLGTDPDSKSVQAAMKEKKKRGQEIHPTIPTGLQGAISVLWSGFPGILTPTSSVYFCMSENMYIAISKEWPNSDD